MRRALAALVRQDERPMKQAILDFDQQRLAASEQLFIQAGNHVPRAGSSVGAPIEVAVHFGIGGEAISVSVVCQPKSSNRSIRGQAS